MPHVLGLEERDETGQDDLLVVVVPVEGAELGHQREQRRQVVPGGPADRSGRRVRPAHGRTVAITTSAEVFGTVRPWPTAPTLTPATRP